MPDDPLEKLLKTVPVRSLSPAADQEIVAAVRAAGPKASTRWWSRPIPIWQAAAACLVVCVATGLVGRPGSGSSDSSQPSPMGSDPGEATSAPHTVFVRLDEPIFPENRRSIDRIDITKWKPLNSD